MSSSPVSNEQVLGMLIQMGPKTHPGTAMLLSSRLEHTLERIIQVNMPHLSNRMKPRLFEGYGPLGSFSAKTDIARALGFISGDDAQLLHAIRAIRNRFAHADEELHFHHPDIKALVAKLPASAKKDPFIAYIDAVQSCTESLGKKQAAYYESLIKGLDEDANNTSPGK